MHACERVRVCVPSLACELHCARLGRQQIRVLGKDGLDLVVLGTVDGGFAILTRAGCQWVRGEGADRHKHISVFMYILSMNDAFDSHAECLCVCVSRERERERKT